MGTFCLTCIDFQTCRRKVDAQHKRYYLSNCVGMVKCHYQLENGENPPKIQVPIVTVSQGPALEMDFSKDSSLGPAVLITPFYLWVCLNQHSDLVLLTYYKFPFV